jgi:hypothetical protein
MDLDDKIDRWFTNDHQKLLMLKSTMDYVKSGQVVDVPRFELGNRNAERIRCFILGFQVAQRLAAWQNTRYGGGL